MDRTLWTKSIYQHSMPAWKCPVCRKGHTVLVPKSVIMKETAASKSQHSHDAWDPDWVESVFTAWGVCSNKACEQSFAVSGIGGVDPEYDDDHGLEWYDYFSPLQCNPMPDIFDLPPKCPDGVSTELRTAFSLFWGYREACAGRVRVALELLMDHLGIPRRKKAKNGKFFDLTLHGRLENFAGKNATIGSHLMALKWLGNAGSHDGTVSTNDLLDAFEVLEHALAEVIDQRSARVAALAKKLTKKHAK